MLRNATRAALLDEQFYDRAEADSSLNVQATVVVITATALGGVGSAIARETSVVAGVIGGVIAGVIGWLLWSLATWLIGTKVFAGTTDFAEMARVLGFAFAPFAIGVIPWLGFPAAVWVLFASLMAVRQGLDFDTKRAFGTVAIGWVMWLAITVALNLLLGWELNVTWPFNQ